MKKLWVMVVVASMSANAAELATSLDGGINAGVVTSLHSAEVSDAHTQGFVGSPPSTALSQTAHALSGSLSAQYVEGHTSISATWTSATQGTMDFAVDGAINATCCGNSVYNNTRDEPRFNHWHYTFVASTNSVLRLGYRITGRGVGSCGYWVYIDDVFNVGTGAPENGTTLANSMDFPLVAGRTYTFALYVCSGFSTTAETLQDYTQTGNFTWEILTPDPGDQVDDLLQDVIDLGLKTGNGFESKLRNALAAIQRGDFNSARALLTSFISSVEAQRGKTLTDAQASALIAAAQAIIDSLPK